MLISDERRMLFVHIPKTGGASVEQLLREMCPDARSVGKQRHARLRRILTQHPELEGYWSFGFVRNPWARMVSWYAMIETWDRRWGPSGARRPASPPTSRCRAPPPAPPGGPAGC